MNPQTQFLFIGPFEMSHDENNFGYLLVNISQELLEHPINYAPLKRCLHRIIITNFDQRPGGYLFPDFDINFIRALIITNSAEIVQDFCNNTAGDLPTMTGGYFVEN